VATSLDPKNAIGILESALAVHEEGLVASCMAVVEQHTEEVLADPAFLTTVTEETLCRVLASPKLSVADELTLYSTVVAWGQSVLRRGWKDVPTVQQGVAAGRSLAEVVAEPMSHVRLGLIDPMQLSTVVMPAGIAPLQDVALALAFHAAGQGAVADADAAQFTARTGTVGRTPVFSVDTHPQPNWFAVDDYGTKVRHANQGATPDSTWIGIRSQQALSEGRQYAEFAGVQTPNKNWMVGVAGASVDLSQTNAFSQADVVVYYGGNGKMYSGNGNAIGWAGAEAAENTDKIGLLVNQDPSHNNVSIEISKNERRLGRMVTGITMTPPLHWYLILSSLGDTAKVYPSMLPK
jgi:hypothetical protein